MSFVSVTHLWHSGQHMRVMAVGLNPTRLRKEKMDINSGDLQKIKIHTNCYVCI